MTPHVLGVGYSYNEYSVTAQAWKEYGIEFDYADDIKQAAAMLSFKEYICIAICADVIPQEDLDALRKVRPVPIIVVPLLIRRHRDTHVFTLVLLSICIHTTIHWQRPPPIRTVCFTICTFQQKNESLLRLSP